jgi:hypothetical protein
VPRRSELAPDHAVLLDCSVDVVVRGRSLINEKIRGLNWLDFEVLLC